MTWPTPRLNIRAKLFLFIIAVAVLFGLILYGLVLPLIESEKRKEREATLQAVVQSAVSLMQSYENGIRTYRWRSDPDFPKTRAEAKKRVLKTLREIRYHVDESVFILDGAAHMVMHPLKKALEGTDMTDVKAPDGSFPFKQMAFHAQHSGSVFIQYNWLSKWSQSINEPQTTYAQYFYPWSWVVCSSLYTQDIDDVIQELTLEITLYFAVGLLIVWGILYLVGMRLVTPILSLAKQVRQAESNPKETASTLITVQSADEIGDLAETFRQTLDRQRRATDQLKISEGRFRDFAMNGADWFWETDQDLKYTYLTGRMEEVTGMKPEQLIGKRRMDIYAQSDLLNNPDIKQNIQTMRERKNFEDLEVSWQRPDGNIRFISLSGKPRFDDQGEFLGYRGVSRDITRRKNLEEQVRRAQKMDAVGQLTSGVAHDFNNILGIIQGNLEILKETAQSQNSSETALDRLEKAQKGLDRGTDITRKLLSFSRKNAQQVQLTLINPFIENIEDLIAKSLTAAIDVRTQLGADLWPVAIDPGDLEDALLNLSLNARDAMPGGGQLLIETGNRVLDAAYIRRNPSAKAGEYVLISVTDTGTGMQEDVKAKILDPFFTTKDPGKGTGLGLSMVYGFVRRSGGHLKIRTEVGKGTTFLLYLPRASVKNLTNNPPKQQSTAMPAGSETILVVDDEKDLREIAVSYVKSLGYKALSASSADHALTMIKNGLEVDLVFSDIVMPDGLDGFQLSSEIHRLRPDIKILLTSGFPKMHDDLDSLKEGFLRGLADNILNKPYKKNQLALALRAILDRESAA